MSDTSQGAGWWQASDEKWYPPESRPAPPRTPAPTVGQQVGGVFLGAMPATPVAPARDDLASTAAKRRQATWLLVGGSAAVGIGCFLPWVKVTAPLLGQITKSGVDGGGDGVGFLVDALLVAWWAFANRQKSPTTKTLRFLVLLLIISIGAGVFFEMADLSRRFAGVDTTYVSFSTGAGLYLMLVGAVVAVIGWLMMPGSAAP